MSHLTDLLYKIFIILKILFNLAFQEKDEEIIEDCKKKLEEISNQVKKLEISCFLSGENDDLIFT